MPGFQSLLTQTDHRPWPLPTGPWVMTQRWHNLLFAHWPLPVEALRPLVPACFDLDTFEGQSWLGIVPFRMSNVRWRWLPAVRGTDRFPELNVRTYVTAGGKPGVYFFSLDAANTLAVWTARRWFNLPYFNAQMSLQEINGRVHYSSRRTHRKASPATFLGEFGPIGDVFAARPGSLEYWLTERYCLYTVDRHGRPYRGEIHHLPWPLQPGQADLERNIMASAAGLDLPQSAPILHYAHFLEVLIWPLRQMVKN